MSLSILKYIQEQQGTIQAPIGVSTPILSDNKPKPILSRLLLSLSKKKQPKTVQPTAVVGARG